MRVLISGITGHIGKILSDMIKKDENLTLSCGVARSGKDDAVYYEENKTEPIYTAFDKVNVDVDMIIDFSNHSLTNNLIDFALRKNVPVVIATTGQTEEEKEKIIEATKQIPIFFAANCSIGVAILIDLAKKVAAEMQDADIEIIETHHNRKIDAPSGTALKIAEELKSVRKDANLVLGRNGHKKREKNDIGINSIRLGNVVGIHEVIVSTNYESITLKHEAYDRALFAEGAIRAAKFLIGKKPGLYGMKDLV